MQGNVIPKQNDWTSDSSMSWSGFVQKQAHFQFSRELRMNFAFVETRQRFLLLASLGLIQFLFPLVMWD